MEHRRQKGSRQEGGSPPGESYLALLSAGSGRHTGNVHPMWKGALVPGRPTRLQSLPTPPGWDACGIKRHGVEEVLFSCPPRQFKLLLVLCVQKQVCQEWTPRVALPQLGCELASSQLDTAASRKHELKQKTSRPDQICSKWLILALPDFTISIMLLPSGLKWISVSW